MLAYFYWDPSPYIFKFLIPILNRPILWYGFLFALGFFLGYHLFKFLLKDWLLSYPFFHKPDLINPKSIAQILNEDKKCLETLSIEKFPKFSSDPGDLCLKLSQILCSLCSKNRQLFRQHLESLLNGCIFPVTTKVKILSEKVSLGCILGAVIGARLADVIFYQDISTFLKDPLVVFRVWEGGLSSHGGALGVVLAIWILSRKKVFSICGLSFLKLMDLISLPAPLVGALIRIGNFMNQEILGRPTNVAWAVVFGHPADGSRPIPRHPVQLYEAIAYLCLFSILLIVWKEMRFRWEKGRLFGLFLSLLFAVRFILEYFKEEQSSYLSPKSFMTMGQILSIPFMILGLTLFLYQDIVKRKKRDKFFKTIFLFSSVIWTLMP